MAQKPKLGFFAGIKNDWVSAAREQKIVKKIFMFLWAFIKLVFKILGFGFFIIYKAFDIMINHSRYGSGANSLASRAQKRGMSISQYEAWMKEQKEIHGTK
ncbi:MAG: hypothetical protein LBI86_10535 [Treponema sp.]|jgi:hypothetical protein|nr:hypothetical protein [Treponema sp.]